MPVLAAKSDCGVSELVEVVHQEIDRLPGKYREPVILCCLEQQTYEQAARQLGTSEPTLRGRLHRGRQKLEARLRARGFSLTDALVLVGREAGPTLRPALVDSTVLLAQRFSVVGGLVTAAVTPSVLSLVQGVIHAMFWNPFKVATFSAPCRRGRAGHGGACTAGAKRERGPGEAGACTYERQHGHAAVGPVIKRNRATAHRPEKRSHSIVARTETGSRFSR